MIRTPDVMSVCSHLVQAALSGDNFGFVTKRISPASNSTIRLTRLHPSIQKEIIYVQITYLRPTHELKIHLFLVDLEGHLH